MKTITTLAILLSVIAPQVGANDQNHAENRCSNADLRGAYSFVRVGGTRATALLARPISQTLFFAGEATSPDQSGTVPGAIESGRRAAQQILGKR